MKRADIAAQVALAVAILSTAFLLTHHRVYGDCHMTVDGKVCALKAWVSNK